MATKLIDAQEDVLDELLRLVVRKWGYAAVSLHLDAIRSQRPGIVASAATDRADMRRHRLSAREYVERKPAPDNKQTILLELAKKFDDKQFLPTIGHIKDFLERRNARMKVLRGRSDAIPRIVEVLADLPDENLEAMLREANYSGPSRLGPLADAIKARSAAIRSSK